MSPKIGMTLIIRNMEMEMAMKHTMTGYDMADLTFFFSRDEASRYVATRSRISASSPPVSPASTMQTNNLLNTFG